MPMSVGTLVGIFMKGQLSYHTIGYLFKVKHHLI